MDCDDVGDCNADVACVDPGECSPVGNLGCGDVIFANNSQPGSTNFQDGYCGFHPGGWTGPEISWVFTPEFDAQVNVTMEGLSQDLDFQAINDEGDGCQIDDCEDTGWGPPPDNEQMDWLGFAGTPYYSWSTAGTGRSATSS